MKNKMIFFYIFIDNEECSRLPVVVGNCGASHFEVITSQEEEQRVTRKANQIGDEYKLDRSARCQGETLQETTAHEDADAGSRNRNRS